MKPFCKGKKLLASVIAIAMLNTSMMAAAQELNVGMKAEISAADPHVLFGPNRNVGGQVFEPLFITDENQRPQPGIATSWSIIEPTIWEIKIRDNVKFHDGSLLTADDVKYSVERARDIEGPRTFRTYLADITDVTIVDPTTIRITTAAPSGILIENLATFGIVSKAATEGATEEDFNGGKAAIGTGPYKWIKWTPGDRVTLERFDDYWGEKPEWQTVVYRFMANDSTRTAALLSGDIDVIDSVPPSLAERLEGDSKVAVESTTSYLLNYLAFDFHHDVPLYVKGPNGEALTTNPFKDVKVRKAISLAINRQLIVDRVMNKLATPAGQLVPEGMTGHVDGIEPEAYDAAQAKALLAEAGYPDGFQVTLHCTNDRYTNDAKVCEAIAQMLSAVGIKTTLDAMPGSVFFTRATSGGPNGEPEFSLFMVGFGAANGVADAALSALVQTFDAETGTGANNRARYSNPELDKLIEAAKAETDQAKRMELLSQATHMVADDEAIAPVHFLDAVWATRSDLKLVPRSDQFTLAREITTAQ